MLSTLWWLLVGHSAADFWAQGEPMARGKNRHWKEGRPPEFPPWFFWLTAHALIHGGAAALATQSVTVGVAETVAHWCIDAGKCEGWYSFYVDQALHVACKVAWCFLLLYT